MKKIISTLFIAGVLAGSCKKAEELKYSSSDNIYLDFNDGNTTDRDSVIYTFAYTPSKTKDTVFIPVRISGIRKPFDRTFRVEVITDSTTAKVNEHYEAFKSEYILPADSGKVRLPVVVYNTDPLLSSKSVTLTFRLAASDDFNVAIVKMITAKLVLSNKLEKPKWWGPGPNTWGIPNYSQVKHELWLLSTGVIDLPFEGIVAPKFLYYMGLLTGFLNNPAEWIASHPDSGYVLELRPDGNYDFYNTNNPGKKILYRKNAQSGKFFFIDENGKEVI